MVLSGADWARDIFRQAIDLDPTYSQPFVGIAYSHQVDILMGYTKCRQASINSLFEAARQAIAIDESNSMAHVMLGFACRWARQHDLAIAEAERAVKLNPSNSFAYILLGNVLDLSGQPGEGIAAIEKGRQLNPLDPRMHLTLAVLARIHLNARRYDEAAMYARQLINHRPDHPGAYAILAVASPRTHGKRLSIVRECAPVTSTHGPVSTDTAILMITSIS